MLSSIIVIIVTVLAAVGHANRYQHAQFHPRRQLNGTNAAGDTLVTSTVYTTQEITITACAPTVSGCPAEESTHTIITTVTVPAYTTICPITMSLSPYSSPAAPIPGSLSSLISTAAATAIPGSGTAPLSSYTGSPPNGNNPSSANAASPASSSASGTAPVYATATTGVPLGTGSPSTSNTAGVSDNTLNTVTYVNNSTLTYTMGTGPSATVVTTIVQFTSTKTLFSTITAMSTPAGYDNVVATAYSDNAAGAATTDSVTGAMPTEAAAGDEVSDEPTTTMFSTSTSTIFITVQTPGFASTTTAVSENVGPYDTTSIAEKNTGSVLSSATGACVVPQTVTITAQFTVTVTAGTGSVPSNPSSTLPFETPISSGSAPTFTGGPYGNGTLTATGYASTGFVKKPSRSCTGGAKGTGSPISGSRRRRQASQ